jgi:hypothetical protein
MRKQVHTGAVKLRRHLTGVERPRADPLLGNERPRADPLLGDEKPKQQPLLRQRPTPPGGGEM